MIANRGDLKGRRSGYMGKLATNARQTAGMGGIEGLSDADAGTRY